MANPISLTSLTPREAVTDALHRVILGVDTNDLELFKSGLTQDCYFDLHGTGLDGLEAICDRIFAVIGPLDTTHHVSNIRVDVKDGADTAYLSAYSLAQHYRPGEGMDPQSKGWLSGVMYFIDLVKDGNDGLWKAKKWVLKTVWGEGDRSVVTR